MKLNLSSLPFELRESAAELLPILKISEASDGVRLTAVKSEARELSVRYGGDEAVITYSEPAFFFRALGLLAEMETGGEVSETPRHNSLGPMLDCSRNGVLTVDSLKRMIRHIALMGHNMLMLYTEDTYTIDGEPYFGYMRGRYSHAELRETDAYCRRFGIELIPCIQTLAHLGEVMKWEAYRPVNDIFDILLVDEPKTYEFIEKMIRTCSEDFSSRRIHVGMDEAWALGTGKYKDLHGVESKASIMRKHLKKVCDICDKYGLSPMMWSDMLFNYDAEGNNRSRYDWETSLPADIHSVPPKNMTLVYWDYYNGDKRIYDGVIEMHRKFDNPVAFAGGAWKWVGFAPLNHYSFTRSKPAIESCFEHGVQDILITAWGDNGCECPFFSVLPVFQLYAEGCFTGDISDERAAKRFATCVGGVMEDFMMLDMPQLPAGNFDRPTDLNPGKYLVYADPFIGLADKHVGADYPAAYAEYAAFLAGAAERNPEWRYLFENSSALCRYLSKKVDLGISFKEAYDAGDKDKLRMLREGRLNDAFAAFEEFFELFRKQWYTECKTFGFEVVDLRFGGLRNRFLTMMRRVDEYLAGGISELPELAEERLRLDCRPGEERADIHCNKWVFVATTNPV